MNYTENYHLPQWEMSDRIMMEDFNAAMSTIDKGMSGAQNTADAAAVLPYVTGGYTGNGGVLNIDIGFRPSIVIVFRNQAGDSPTITAGTIAMAGENVSCDGKITLTDTGFCLNYKGDLARDYPKINYGGWIYHYIAFR